MYVRIKDARVSLGIQSPFPVGDCFPAQEVESCIRKLLDAEHAAQQLLRPQAASACEPDVDSLVVIEVICAIEEFLDVMLPASFAPRGGYNNVEACISDLLLETHAVWVELIKQAEEHHV